MALKSITSGTPALVKLTITSSSRDGDMRVLCAANSGRSLSENHFGMGYTPSSEFDLEVGKEYVVYGISLWKGFLLYLVIGEGLFPHWYPSELFDVTRNEMPPIWYFARFSEEEGLDLNAVWGYDELANTQDHFNDLSNLEECAINVFMERKKQIDEVS